MPAVLAALIEFLAGPDGMPGFDREPRYYQMGLTQMMWMSLQKRRRHKVYKNAASFSKQEIRQLFGSDAAFRRINRGSPARYFHVHRFQNHPSNKQESYTNGYELQPWMKYLFNAFLQSESHSELYDDKGRVIRKAPPAIKSKDQKNNNVTGWNGDDAPSLVKVNLENVRACEDYWRMLRNASRFHLLPDAVPYPGDDKTDHIVDSAAAVRHWASSKRFAGYLLHQYVQAPSGRLYAGGVNLQNCPRVVRNAALAGCYDYDIRCCHFDIMRQMAGMFGYDCEVIKHYVENKSAVRNQIARDVGITVEQVKTVLTATIYGARNNLREKDAIPEAIGLDAAARLYVNPAYKAIRDELSAAMHVILEKHSLKSGKYVNLFGKAITPAEHDNEQVMSHLLTGVEAVALRAAIRNCRDKVVLLQHDGFVASERVDIAEMEEAVNHATGGKYRLTFEEKPIEFVLPDFSGAAWADEVKLMNAQKLNAGAAFRRVLSGDGATVVTYWHQLPIPSVYPDPWPPADWPDPFANNLDNRPHPPSLIASRRRKGKSDASS